LHTGAPWRDLPRRYGPWQTAFDRFNKMRQSGLLARILQRLRLRLNDAGLIDPESFGHAASAC
jgi:transposase